MFDFGDLFSPNGTEGTRWMRIVAGIIGAVCGGGLGVLAGSVLGQTDLAPTSYGIIGAIVGGGMGAIFAGLVMVILIALIAVVAVFAWQYFTGTI